jgi:hypothetical protein
VNDPKRLPNSELCRIEEIFCGNPSHSQLLIYNTAIHDGPKLIAEIRALQAELAGYRATLANYRAANQASLSENAQLRGILVELTGVLEEVKAALKK